MNFIKNEKLVMGLEVHITLKTKEKVFNKNSVFDDSDEKKISNLGPWELGHLGSLPFVNSEVIKDAITLCSSFESEISNKILFDRKIYSYFDLPKGFQITQQREPIGKNGFLPVFINGKFLKIEIDRIQIEEDTAKSFYEKDLVYLDFRRAGNPLIEVVTKPSFNNVEEVIEFAKQLRSLVIYLGISDAKMERGQFRMDLNFSFEFDDSSYITPRYELKNLNSFKNLKSALDQEFEKHKKIYVDSCFLNLKTNSLVSQTLGFNEETQKTFVQRKKNSYFYLPESNIVPINVEKKYISKSLEKLPILPWKIIEEFEIKDRKKILYDKNFLEFIKFLKKKNICYSHCSNKILAFVLNYLNPAFYNSIKPINFEKNSIKFWKILCFWQSGFIEKEDLKDLIFLSSKTKKFSELKDLINSKKKLPVEFIDLKKAFFEILNSEENKKKIQNFFQDKTKYFGFFFGKLKEKFPKKIVKHSDVKSLLFDFENR